jgi:plastocyanin
MARRMAPPRRGEARRRHGRRLLLLVLVLSVVGFSQLSARVAADEQVVEPAETTSGFVWKPASATSAPGGTVAFRNPSNLVPHGVAWTGGPEKPSCNGVPVDSSGTGWNGTCAFAGTGTYTFACIVHPEEMKGTITVASGETAPPPTPGDGQPSPSESPVVEGWRLAQDQRGHAVRGSITVSTATVGGRLKVGLEAKRASLGTNGTGVVRIGSFARSLTRAGRQSFVVTLRTSARRALRRRGRMSTIVKIVIAPPSGPAVTMKRRVELHA